MKRRQDVPQAYLELLDEYKRDEKRIKTASRINSPDLEPETYVPSDPAQLAPEQESSDEDEWDEVNLEDQENNDYRDIEVNDIQINFKKPDPVKKDTMPRRLKVQIHASCLVLLFAHTRMRNSWTQCNEIRVALCNAFPSIILQQLVPPAHLSATLKTKNLLTGLQQAAKWWSNRFAVNNTGLYMVNWAEVRDNSREVQGPITRQTFIDNIKQHRGSHDELGQGFCALLRAHGFECRLVCSLQPPDFMAQGSKKRADHASVFPIYWTEVWDAYSLQWITVDPITGCVQAIRRDSPMEPPQNDSRNLLRYCIAWFGNGTCRDVTRRYANKFSARTRKKRLDYIPQYKSLYSRILARFSPRQFSARDVKELKDLHRRELTEGIPSRVQDFVGHPFYCLEHQLKKAEILEPKISCGTLAIKGEIIPIYPRKHVKLCRSAQSWYRSGKILIAGVQPKVYRSKRDKLTGEEERVALYSEDQTKLYVPPPVTDGIVPKSEYRTIDIFTRQMLPVGAVHMKHPLAQRAAKILGADYANAVVSVEFQKGGAPKSKYSGIVVAKETELAILESIRQLQKISLKEAKEEVKVRNLYLWKQFIVAAQIRRRVDGNDIGFEVTDTEAWPFYVDYAETDESQSEISEGESECEAVPDTSLIEPDDARKATEPESQTPTTSHSIRIAMNDLLYDKPQVEVSSTTTNDPAKGLKSPTHSDLEDEYPDMMLDELDESDFDV